MLAACAAALAGGTLVAGAQIRIVKPSVLDSIAAPKLAPGAEAMRFEATTVGTGSINEDDAPSVYDYRFRNEGREPLAVISLRTSCGCATAEAVPKTVEAGAEGVIRVTYRPKGHPGRFMRKVFVFTQLSETQPTAVLTLNADVAPGSDRSTEFRYSMGSLLLKRNTLTFTRGKSGSESIEVYNASDRVMTIGCRQQMLPGFLSFSCTPAQIEPGGRGDITVGYDDGAYPEGRDGMTVPLALTGTGQSVLQSIVKVIVEEK